MPPYVMDRWQIKTTVLSAQSDLTIVVGPEWCERKHNVGRPKPSHQQCNMKSVNLQYNTLGCLDDGTNESSTKHLMLQVLFLSHDILQNSLHIILQIDGFLVLFNFSPVLSEFLDPNNF